MVWKDPNAEVKELAPIPQEILVQYTGFTEDELPTLKQHEKHLYAAASRLSHIWGDIPSWSISGAVGVYHTTGKLSRIHTNLDIALLRDEDLLETMVERARDRNLYLVVRDRSYKRHFNPISKYKTERYHPAKPLPLIRNLSKNLNPMLVSVDSQGNIMPFNSITTRIRLFFYYPDSTEPSILLCTEDNTLMTQDELRGKVVYNFEQGRKVYVAHPRFLLRLKEMKQTTKWFFFHKEKHRTDYSDLTDFLKEHPEWR